MLLLLIEQIEMEIARIVEENRSLLSIGLELAVADARVRVSRKLQENRDRCMYCYLYSSAYSDIYIGQVI